MKSLKCNNVVIIVVKKIVIELLFFKVTHLIISKNVGLKENRLLYIRDKYI